MVASWAAAGRLSISLQFLSFRSQVDHSREGLRGRRAEEGAVLRCACTLVPVRRSLEAPSLVARAGLEPAPHSLLFIVTWSLNSGSQLNLTGGVFSGEIDINSFSADIN